RHGGVGGLIAARARVDDRGDGRQTGREQIGARLEVRAPPRAEPDRQIAGLERLGRGRTVGQHRHPVAAALALPDQLDEVRFDDQLEVRTTGDRPAGAPIVAFEHYDLDPVALATLAKLVEAGGQTWAQTDPRDRALTIAQEQQLLACLLGGVETLVVRFTLVRWIEAVSVVGPLERSRDGLLKLVLVAIANRDDP